MYKIILSILLSCFLCLTALSQNAILDKVDNLIWDTQFIEAINLIDRSLDNSLNQETEVKLLNKKADALIRIGKLQEASQLLKKIEDGLSTSKQDQILKAITKSNQGFLQLNIGRTDLAEEELSKAINLFEESGKPECLDAAQALSNLGLVYINTGKYTQAEEQMQQALRLRQQQLKGTHELIAATYNDLGLVYSQTDKDKALDYYEKAISMYTKLHSEGNLKIAFANINTGIVYRDLKLYGDAVNDFENALTIFNKVYTHAHPSKAITLYNLGQTYLNMDNRKAAGEYYNQALGMYIQSYGEKHPEIAYIYNAIGNLQLSEGKYDQALSSYQNALKANVADFDNDNIESDPALENYYNGIRLLQSFLYKSQALETKYLSQTLKFSDLEQALGILQKCDKLIEMLRHQINNESDKIQLGIVASEVYADGVRIAHTAGLNAFKKKTHYELAFYFAEKSKSAVLLEAISDSDAKSFAGIPSDLLKQENSLKSSMALHARQLAQGPAPEEEKKLRETIFQLNRDYDNFIQKLEKDFPDYFNLKFNQALPSISQLQRVLNSQTTILSYFLDDKNLRLYIFEINKKGFKIIDKTLSENYDRDITGLRNSIFYTNAKVYRETAYELYKILIPKLSGNTKQLIILPTGRLSVIPFEALLSKVSEDETFSELPYLIRKYDVQYEFAASLILQKAKDKVLKGQPSIFLCAPVQFPERDNLNELPGTEKEVKEIASLFSAKNLLNKCYTGKDANESLIKTGDLNQYSLLHLATHGVVDETNPELSRIFLQTSSQEDGNLFAGEIYNLKLNADLVTLSACQTGLGKISKGEGVIGLSRALIYAGAHHIIVSYWSVADESTAELMKNFYGSLLNDSSADYSTNLRKSKLELIASQTYSSPFYWAPFVLIGF